MRLADAAETEELGARIADALLALAHVAATGDVRERSVHGLVFLEGELGAGKTTLARGIIRRLGFQGPVKSPTYTVVEPYVREPLRIYHFDLYRLNDPAELEHLGARDYFSGTALCLVEWPERAGGWLPPPDLRLRLAVDGSARRLRVEARTRLGEALAVSLASI